MGNQQSKLNVYMTGLSNSGSTTILYRLKLDEVITTTPTIGFNVENITFRNCLFTLWDWGMMRNKTAESGDTEFWVYSYSSNPYYEAIIYVIDCSDLESLAQAKDQLHYFLREAKVNKTTPLLVYGNKQDRPNAISATELSNYLDLNSTGHILWYIQASCATNGFGLYEGLYWLLSANKQRQGLVKESQNAEKRNLKAIENAIKYRGKLEQDLVHGVFIGVPRSGKSSLMLRLLSEGIKHTSPSTGVIDKVVQVEVKKSSGATVNVVGSSSSLSKWVRISYNEEALGYGAMMLTPATQGIAARRPAPSSVDKKQMKTKNQTIPKQSKSLSTSLKSISSMPKATLRTLFKAPPSSSLPQGYKPPVDILKDAFKDCGKTLEEFQKEFQNTWSLYLTDTGGQIEFQELLPLLVSSPSIFFLIFRLDHDLTQKFTIEYLHPTDGASKPYRSTLTIRDALLQSLVSIAAMRTFVFRGDLADANTEVRPKVFFVATHKDQLDPAIADDHIKKVDLQLQEMVKSTSLYHDNVVQFASKTQLVFTVNNLSEDETDFQQIRLAVDRIVAKGEFNVSLPSTWLIYNLALRRLQSQIISYEEAALIARKNGITNQEEFDEVLYFLHSKLGVIRHFPVDALLKDVIVLDPQLLFDKVTDLILETFSFENVRERITTEFKNKGIFPVDVFQNMKLEQDELLTPQRLIKLLEQLRIIAPYQTKVVPHEYFIPCALAHTEDVPMSAEDTLSDVPPLMITFKSGYVPKGVAGSLVVYLLRNEMQSEFEVKLKADTIFKNQLSFSVGPHYDLVSLRMEATHFTVSISFQRPPKRMCTFYELCTEVRRSIEKGIVDVMHDLPYAKDIVHSLTFHCTGCKDYHPAEMSMYKGAPCELHCSKTKTNHELPLGYNQWFPEATSPSLSSLNTTKLPPQDTSTQITDDQSIGLDHPTQKNLTLLKWADAEGKTQRLRIIESVGTKWREIGRILNIPEAHLKSWGRQFQEDCIDCCSAVFDWWLSQDIQDEEDSTAVNSYSKSWEGVFELLEDVECSEVAESLKEALSHF